MIKLTHALFLCFILVAAVQAQDQAQEDNNAVTEVIVKGLGESEADSFESGSEVITDSLPSSQDLGVAEAEGVVDDSLGESSQSLMDSELLLKAQAPTGVYSEIKLEEADREEENPQRRVQVSARYLGVLGQAGFDIKVFNQVSMGLYYGKFQGTVAGNEKAGVIPDLHQLNLQTTVFLNSQKQAFQSGAQLRFGIHVNQQKESELVDRVEVDGKEVIRPGQTKTGALLGIGYGWYFNHFGVNVGAEYLSLGALKTLIPLVVSLGVTF